MWLLITNRQMTLLKVYIFITTGGNVLQCIEKENAGSTLAICDKILRWQCLYVCYKKHIEQFSIECRK